MNERSIQAHKDAHKFISLQQHKTNNNNNTTELVVMRWKQKPDLIEQKRVKAQPSECCKPKQMNLEPHEIIIIKSIGK